MVFDVVSDDGAFVEGDECVPRLRSEAEVENICQRKGRDDLDLQFVGQGEEELIEGDRAGSSVDDGSGSGHGYSFRFDRRNDSRDRSLGVPQRNSLSNAEETALILLRLHRLGLAIGGLGFAQG